jgi:hypothetical protein
MRGSVVEGTRAPGEAEGDRIPVLRIANGFDGPMRAFTCSAIQRH